MINSCLATQPWPHLIRTPPSYVWEHWVLMMKPLTSSTYCLSSSVVKYLPCHVSWRPYISLCLEGESQVRVYVLNTPDKTTNWKWCYPKSLLAAQFLFLRRSVSARVWLTHNSLHYVWTKCCLLGKQASYDTNLLNKYWYILNIWQESKASLWPSH